MNLNMSSEQQNKKQKLNIIKGFVGDFIGIFIGNMMILFIPQTSESTTTYSISVFIFNISTFTLFIYLYFVEMKREFWLINNLDYSKRYDSLHLRTYKNQYPELFNILENINKHYYTVYRIIMYIFIINAIYSMVFIVFNYESYRLITSFFSNFWFCWSKICKGIDIANESIKNGIGYSYYNSLSMSFNRIDSKIKKHISNSNLPSLNSSFNEAQFEATI